MSREDSESRKRRSILEERRGQARLIENVQDPLDEAGAAQLAGGQVHVDRLALARFRQPQGRLLAGFAEHPFPQPTDEA